MLRRCCIALRVLSLLLGLCVTAGRPAATRAQDAPPAAPDPTVAASLQVEALLLEGNERYRQGRYREAALAYQRASQRAQDIPIASRPWQLFALFQLSLAYNKDGQDEQAILCLQRLVELTPMEPSPRWQPSDHEQILRLYQRAQGELVTLQRHRDEVAALRQQQREQEARQQAQAQAAQAARRRAGRWYRQGWLWGVVAGGVGLTIALGVGLGLGAATGHAPGHPPLEPSGSSAGARGGAQGRQRSTLPRSPTSQMLSGSKA